MIGTVAFTPNLPSDFVSLFPVLNDRTAASLVAALILSQIAAALVFDGARCIRWWQAPLVASLWGAFVFAAVFYPASELGSNAPWFGQMLIHFGIMAGLSVLPLIPYWVFRPLVRPLPGFAGY